MGREEIQVFCRPRTATVHTAQAQLQVKSVVNHEKRRREEEERRDKGYRENNNREEEAQEEEEKRGGRRGEEGREGPTCASCRA